MDAVNNTLLPLDADDAVAVIVALPVPAVDDNVNQEGLPVIVQLAVVVMLNSVVPPDFGIYTVDGDTVMFSVTADVCVPDIVWYVDAKVEPE